MANIVITNICNLQCKYCFAENLKENQNNFITLGELYRILNFCKTSPETAMGIIGGEPTLHPMFKQILEIMNNYSIENDLDTMIFTNGIELEKFLPYIGERQRILINCNSPKYQTKSQYDALISTLNAIEKKGWYDYKKVICGCNIHLDCDNYDYFWDIVKKYNLKEIRCSVVNPSGEYEDWTNKKTEYFNKIKPLYIEFCKKAKENNCFIEMDCAKIPICYFSEEELEFIKIQTKNTCLESYCYPVVDILPDYKAVACFGDFVPVDIELFKDINELRRYLHIKKMTPKLEANQDGRCLICPRHSLLQCQGGCLKFAQI